MSGVEVWRDSPGRFVSAPSRAVRDCGEQGRWFPEAEAAALLDVAAAMRDTTGRLNMWICLDALDAARAQQTPTIHPPAHYQIDTSTPGWNTRYVDAVAKEHGWTRAEAQGRIADGGAG